jgi:hypothetical protein
MKNFLNIIVVFVLVVSMTPWATAQKYRQKQINSADLSSGESLEFENVEAFTDGNGVLIKWNTKIEKGNIGFNIYRVDGKDRLKINKNLVSGQYLKSNLETPGGDSYLFFDTKGSINAIYQIENISVNTINQKSELIYTQFVTNLRNVSAQTSSEFQKSAREANPVSIKNSPDLPDGLKNLSDPANSLSDINKQRQIASQPGVKIHVKSDGFFRVTKAELQAAGFDTNSSPNLWQLYLNGIEQAINVQSNGDYIEFYGKGIETLHSNTNIYFLTVGTQNGKRIGTTIRRRIGGTVEAKNFDSIVRKKDSAYYVSSVLNGDAENWFGGFISSAPTLVNFELNGIDYSYAKTNLFLSIQGFTFVPHQVEVKINGVDLGQINGNNRDLFSRSQSVPVSILQEGTNTLELKSLGGPSDFNFVGEMRLQYKRKYQALGNKLAFYTLNMRRTIVKGFASPNIRVFDITYPDSPSLITNAQVQPEDKSGTSYSVTLPANRTKNMYAFEDAALKQVDSITQNVPSTLSSNTNEGEYLILTHRNWLTEANNWAAYRQNEGFVVKVVDVTDAFDEFGFGISSSKAVTDFVEYAKNNWQTPPNFVLILGDGSFDSKNHLGLGNHDYVPIRLVDTLYEETASDDALVDFDNNGSAEISIGRIPARNPQDVTNALNKVVTFESTLATAPSRGSLCASDLPNGYDFAGSCDRVHNELPDTIPTSVVNRGDPGAQATLISAINSGKYIVNYSGHGSTNIWAATNFFGSNNVSQLTNNTQLSIFSMLTCLNGYFIHPTDDSLSEALLKTVNGGAVAVWSSSGRTTPDVQEEMAKRYFNQIGNNPEMNRLGDLIRDAKSILVGGADVKRSWVLLGDPALKVK